MCSTGEFLFKHTFPCLDFIKRVVLLPAKLGLSLRERSGSISAPAARAVASAASGWSTSG